MQKWLTEKYERTRCTASRSDSPKKGLQVRGLALAIHSFFTTEENIHAKTAHFISRPLLRGRAKTDKLISYWGKTFCLCWKGGWNLVRVNKMLELRFQCWLRLGPNLCSGVWTCVNHIPILTLMFRNLQTKSNTILIDTWFIFCLPCFRASSPGEARVWTGPQTSSVCGLISQGLYQNSTRILHVFGKFFVVVCTRRKMCTSVASCLL